MAWRARARCESACVQTSTTSGRAASPSSRLGQVAAPNVVWAARRREASGSATITSRTPSSWRCPTCRNPMDPHPATSAFIAPSLPNPEDGRAMHDVPLGEFLLPEHVLHRALEVREELGQPPAERVLAEGVHAGHAVEEGQGDEPAVADHAQHLRAGPGDVVAVGDGVGGIHEVELSVGEGEGVHVHELDERTLAHEVDGHDVLATEAVEPEEQDLRFVAGADGQDTHGGGAESLDAAQDVHQPLRPIAKHASGLALTVGNDS